MAQEGGGEWYQSIHFDTLVCRQVFFSALKGHHHERSIKRLAASEQLFVEHWLIDVEKSGKICPRRNI